MNVKDFQINDLFVLGLVLNGINYPHRIYRLTKLTPSAIPKIVNRLEKLGLVTREVVGRINYISLTNKGEFVARLVDSLNKFDEEGEEIVEGEDKQHTEREEVSE